MSAKKEKVDVKSVKNNGSTMKIKLQILCPISHSKPLSVEFDFRHQTQQPLVIASEIIGEFNLPQRFTQKVERAILDAISKANAMKFKPLFLHNQVDTMIVNIITASARYICNYDRSIYIPKDVCLYISFYCMNMVDINNETVKDLYNVYKKTNKMTRFEMIYVQAGLRSLWQKYQIPHKPFRKKIGGVNFGVEFDF